jgi:mannose-6-phosphate isomerase-like protein (cupin superfamily)
MKYHVTIEDAKRSLTEEVINKFTVLLKHGSMQVEYFAPDKIDSQTPHVQDEIYVIASGKSYFIRNNETIECKQGDILFVPAGMEHRFEQFSENFATWVIFYGKKGGEEI